MGRRHDRRYAINCAQDWLGFDAEALPRGIGARARHADDTGLESRTTNAFAEAKAWCGIDLAQLGRTSTSLRPLREPNFTAPSALANSVSSPPMPTFCGWNLVPRWRTMIRQRSRRCRRRP